MPSCFEVSLSPRAGRVLAGMVAAAILCAWHGDTTRGGLLHAILRVEVLPVEVYYPQRTWRYSQYGRYGRNRDAPCFAQRYYPWGYTSGMVGRVGSKVVE
jgi:hypothetical protein